MMEHLVVFISTFLSYNNIYFKPNSTSTKIWSSLNLASVQALGSETNGLISNPNFVTPGTDFHLQAGSPGIDAGATLSAPYNVDIDGVARPQGGFWDIGIYEQ